MANLTWDPVNNVWTGTFTVGPNGNSNETYTIPITNTTGNVTASLDGINTSLFPGATNSITVIDCSSWTLTSNPASGSTIKEGSNIQVTLTTANVANGNYPFSIKGLQNGDLSTGSGSDVSWDGVSKYVGTFKLNNNIATITLNVLSDNNSENPETLTLSLDNGEGNSITITINDPALPSWSLTSNPASGSTIKEGNNIQVTLTTANVADGNYPFSINGLQNGDLLTGSGSDVSWDGVSKYVGTFKLNNNIATITLNVLSDNNSENPETLTLSLDNGEGNSITITINDPAPPAACGDDVPDWISGKSKFVTTTGDTSPARLGYYNILGFENGGTIYLPESSAAIGNDTMVIYIPIDPNSPPTEGVISWSMVPSIENSAFFYKDLKGDCWKGNLKSGQALNPLTLTKI